MTKSKATPSGHAGHAIEVREVRIPPIRLPGTRIPPIRLPEPCGFRAGPNREQRDIEHVSPIGLFLNRQQVEQERPNIAAVQSFRDAILLGLRRLEPLPCANATTDLAGNALDQIRTLTRADLMVIERDR